MKKKILTILLVGVLAITLTGCFDKTEESDKKDEKGETKIGLAFKKDYEEVNGQKNNNGKVHRSITIDEDNVFVETTPEKVSEMIDNGETFYVYFGSRLCPWCRSVIEKAVEVSIENGIEKIYYIDIWCSCCRPSS